MRKWKKIAQDALEANKTLEEELRALREETAYQNGCFAAALEELERVKNEARELAKQLGAALKELELRGRNGREEPEGRLSREAQWENMMNYTGERQEGDR